MRTIPGAITNFLLVRINEYNSLLRIHQYENLAQVRSNISEILRDTGTKREATVYRIGASTFAVHCRDKEQIKRLHELFYPICQNGGRLRMK